MIRGLLFLILIAAALGGLAGACSGPPTLPFLTESAGQSPTTAAAPVSSTITEVTASAVAPTTSQPTPTTTTPTTTTPTTTTPTTTTSNPYPPGVLIIGDSVLEGLRVLHYSFGPNTVYDTAVSRSVLKLPEVLADHDVPQDLVVHLGTNGWWPDLGESISDTIDDFSDRRIVLVNISVDRAYTGLANTELQAIADNHPHVTLVDWNSAASPELLRTDGFHPNLEGYNVIAHLIADALDVPPEYELLPTTTTQPPADDVARSARSVH